MRHRDEVRSVEVVLEEPPAVAGSADTAVGPAPADAGRRRRRWGAGAVLLVAVVVLALVEARADRREREALAAHAEVPGVVASLAEPLREAWHLPVFPPIAVAGGVVVTVDEPDVLGLDLTTGERRWTLSRPVGSPRPFCPWTVPGDDGAARVLCAPLRAASGQFTAFGVDVLDAATGEVTGSIGADGFHLSIAPVAGGVATIEPRADAGLTVTVHDLPAGGVRWTVPADGVELGVPELVVHGDRQVVALEAATTVVLDARDGRVLGRWETEPDGVAPAVGRVVSHPGAGFGVWPSRFAGRWYAPDGTPGAALDGEPVVPEVDDGGAPGIVLLRNATGDRLRGVDVASGDELWDRPAPGRVLLQLDGRLVLTGDTRLEAWDVATGDVAWSVPLDPGEEPNRGVPYTDGVRVVLRGEDGDGPRLTAYRIEDGARVWRAPLPAGTDLVTVLGDRLAAVGRFDGRVESAAVLGQR